MSIEAVRAWRSGWVLRSACRLDRALRRARIESLAPVRALRSVSKRLLLQAFAADDRLILAEVEGHPMFIPRRFVNHYILKKFEPLTAALFRQAIRRGSVVLDIGAHVGFYSLLAAREAGPEGHVFAFEPGPDNFPVLQRNLHLNGNRNVSAVRLAAGAEVTRRTLLLSDSSDLHGFYPNPFSPASRGSWPVRCVTVDSFLGTRLGDGVKMDVEGAEPEVLAGMRATLASGRRLVLFVEMSPACLRAAGHSPADLLGILMDAGFSVAWIEERAGRIVPVPSREFVPSQDTFGYANLYCVRN